MEMMRKLDAFFSRQRLRRFKWILIRMCIMLIAITLLHWFLILSVWFVWIYVVALIVLVIMTLGLLF